MSPDELLLVFTSLRPGGPGLADIYHTTRTSSNKRFEPATLVPDVNSSATDGDAHLSPDGCRLYFASNRTGDFDLYLAVAR